MSGRVGLESGECEFILTYNRLTQNVEPPPSLPMYNDNKKFQQRAIETMDSVFLSIVSMADKPKARQSLQVSLRSDKLRSNYSRFWLST